MGSSSRGWLLQLCATPGEVRGKGPPRSVCGVRASYLLWAQGQGSCWPLLGRGGAKLGLHSGWMRVGQAGVALRTGGYRVGYSHPKVCSCNTLSQNQHLPTMPQAQPWPSAPTVKRQAQCLAADSPLSPCTQIWGTCAPPIPSPSRTFLTPPPIHPSGLGHRHLIKNHRSMGRREDSLFSPLISPVSTTCSPIN